MWEEERVKLESFYDSIHMATNRFMTETALDDEASIRSM